MSPRALRTLVLAAAALAAAWAAFQWFRPVNRVQRATYRLLAVCPKDAPGAEPPLDTVRVLSAFRAALAPDAVAAVAPDGEIRGRDSILQAVQVLRPCADTLWLDHPVVRARALDRRTVEVLVDVPWKIRLSSACSSLSSGRRWDYDLHARLLWGKTPDGWRILRADLAPFRGIPLPGSPAAS